MEIFHIPVLLNETLQYLNLNEGSIVIDCTVGEGGHSEEILKRIGPSGFLFGIDQDSEALLKAKKRLSSIGSNFTLINDNFSRISEIRKQFGIPPADAIVADLGISSLQLHLPYRGFSFMKEGPLDMRMNPNAPLTASDVVNGYSEKDLADIIYTFGEERRSRQIAKAIVLYRKNKKIETTTELAGIIEKIYRYKRGAIHPATKTFQALRIFINGELNSLKRFLDDAPDLLKAGGRIAVISYHSLEDRIVKESFKTDERLKRINKKVIRATHEEILSNRRARSAKLRVAERT